MYKAELVRNKGPWNSVDDLEIATAQWVYWYTTIRPHSAINMHTPEEHENAYTPPPPEQTRPHTPKRQPPQPDETPSTKPGA